MNSTSHEKLGHVCMVWGASIHYTETELRKINRHFHQPRKEKLSAVIKRASPKNFTSSVVWKTWKKFKMSVSSANESQMVSIDLLYHSHRRTVCYRRSFSRIHDAWNDQSALHVVDRDKNLKPHVSSLEFETSASGRHYHPFAYPRTLDKQNALLLVRGHNSNVMSGRISYTRLESSCIRQMWKITTHVVSGSSIAQFYCVHTAK